MAFDRNKFKTLVHYVCLTCDPEKLGAVKLNKILWWSDFRAFHKLGNPITGARYVKRQYGPVPSAITPILKELESEGLISMDTGDFYGRSKTEFRAKGQPDMSRFSSEELKIIMQAILFVVEEHTAKSISEFSHDHIWQAASDGEELPYSTVFAVPGQITDDEREWAKMELEDHG